MLMLVKSIFFPSANSKVSIILLLSNWSVIVILSVVILPFASVKVITRLLLSFVKIA